MTLLARIETLRDKLRRAAASDEALEVEVDDSIYDALGTAAKEIAARGLLLALPSIRVARRSEVSSVPFRWPKPSSAKVELETDKSGKVALCEYRIALDEGGVLRHSDFQFTRVMDAYIKGDPQNMLLAAKAHALAAKIPDFVIDVSGAVTGLKDANESARNFADISNNDQLLNFMPLGAKFWYAWCQSFLGLPVTGPGSRGVVRVVHDLMGGEQLENDAEFACEKFVERAGYWVVSLESKLVDPPRGPITRAVHSLLQDPELRIDDLLAQSTELFVKLEAVVEPNTFRPVVASRLVGASVGNSDRPQGQEYESQIWTFDWDAS